MSLKFAQFASNTVTVITDCAGPKAAATEIRQELTWERFGFTASLKHVTDTGGAFLSILGALEAAHPIAHVPTGQEEITKIIFSNIARRGSASAKEFENGPPFCYFQYGRCLVVTTFCPLLFSLFRQFGITDNVFVIDTGDTLTKWVRDELISETQAKIIRASQFRSKDFVAEAIFHLTNDPALIQGRIHSIALDSLPLLGTLLGPCEHGNLKLALRPEDIDFAPGKPVDTVFGAIPAYDGLKSVPDGVLALVPGSHRIGETCLLELVIGNGDASQLPIPGISKAARFGDRIVCEQAIG